MYSGVRESVEDNLYVGKRLSAGVVDSLLHRKGYSSGIS